MRAFWLVNQLWFIEPVNWWENRASSELLYYDTRRIRKSLARGSWFTNSSSVLPTSCMIYQPINHRNLWSTAWIFAAKHIWTVLRMSRPLFMSGYLQVTWWALGQWKERKMHWMIKGIIGRTAKSVTKLLNFSGRHIWRWFPTIPTIFPTVSYSDVTFSLQVKTWLPR